MSPNGRPRLLLLHSGGASPHPSQIRRDHTTMPISITLHGERTVALFREAVEEQREKPIPGESAPDVIRRALGVVFEDIKLGESEAQPLTVVAEALDRTASVQVFTASPEPPPPPPRCG